MLTKIKEIIKFLRNLPDPNWEIEINAKPSKTHPLAGFWKRDMGHDHSIAIGPQDDEYYISFCGPGGCFSKGKYRPNSKIIGDPSYRVVDENIIEIKSKNGFTKYVRAKSREVKK